jgi:hypothetical protein
MRVLGVIMAAVVVLVSAPTDAAAQTDLSGMWALTIQSDQGNQPLAITITQDGQNLTAMGDGGEIGPVEMKGMLDGSDVLFEWSLFIEGMELAITFTGTIAEDGTLSGTADFGGFGAGDWTAKRVET